MDDINSGLHEIDRTGLTGTLFDLVGRVNDEAISYQSRERDTEMMADFLASGNHAMAEMWANKMIEQQQQYRDTQQHGLPATLQHLLDQVNVEAFEYEGRDRDTTMLADFLASGNHSMAEMWAKKVIEQQQQCRNTQQHGLPAALQHLLDQVNAEAFEYEGRDRDTTMLADFLTSGNHSMAEMWAKKVIEQQQQCRNTQQHGLPAALQHLVDQVNAEAFEYEGRDRDTTMLADFLTSGNHSMAEMWAKKVIEQQQRCRNTQQHGLPAALQHLLDQVNAEAFEYEGRDRDTTMLADFLASGNHSMAEMWANKIIEQQRNVRSRVINGNS